ncbi:TSUP family transporter [Chlamydiota bacterium]
MEYFVLCTVSLLVSILALLSGFGLGTILMPIFAFFFPIPLAIAATAVVHLVNNLFQLALVGKWAKWSVVIRFGIPALLTALLGAYLLVFFIHIPTFFTYAFHWVTVRMTAVGLLVGSLVMLSSLFELIPRLSHLSLPARYLPIGGALSGFFGGLTGNQGILRSAFLIKAGLNTEQFVGTSAVCSVIVDTARLIVYGLAIYTHQFALLQGISGLVAAASLTAILGSLIGSKIVPHITLRSLQILVGCMLLLLGFALFLGLGLTKH